jgi:F-type H+-transporting ATPase subunit b
MALGLSPFLISIGQTEKSHIMDLITPGSGLIFWQLIGFLGLLFILIKFAWKPMLAALEERESTIENALKQAEIARNEMANLKAENEKLLAEARLERDNILKKAQEASNKMIEEAKTEAQKQGAQLIENAKAVIETEKKAALTEVKNQVAALTLEVTEKLLKKNLADDASQKALVDEFVKDLKLN